MGFEEEWGNSRGPDFERAGINSPVTIVEGGRGPGCDGGPRINLEQYTDYVLDKYHRRREWDDAAGIRGGDESMHFKNVAAVADTPLRAIGSTIVDGMYVLVMGLACKVAAAGTGTMTLTVTYYDLLAGSTAVTLTQALTATGKVDSGPTPIFLLGGSAVTVNCTNSGTYSTAQYDAFVGLLRVG